MTAPVKWLLLCAAMAAISGSVSGNLLKQAIPIMLDKYYNNAPAKTDYHLVVENPNGSRREEILMILNFGTPQQENVVMGMYTTYDDKTDMEYTTIYTADKNGTKARSSQRKRRPRDVNKSITGGRL